MNWKNRYRELKMHFDHLQARHASLVEWTETVEEQNAALGTEVQELKKLLDATNEGHAVMKAITDKQMDEFNRELSDLRAENRELWRSQSIGAQG